MFPPASRTTKVGSWSRRPVLTARRPSRDGSRRTLPRKPFRAAYPASSASEIDPDDPAPQGVRPAARGLIALSPVELPVMQAPPPPPPAPAAPQPVGMTLPMA